MHWYCLHTKPLKETQVAAFCRSRLGLETYFPRLRQVRVIRRQRRIVTGPLFPRYLFCRFDPAAAYRMVKYAPDVLDVVSGGNAPTIVADSLIAGLREWAGEELDMITLQPALRVGSRVEVLGGPFHGVFGTILKEAEGSARVTILLSILQAGAQLTVDRSELRLTA